MIILPLLFFCRHKFTASILAVKVTCGHGEVLFLGTFPSHSRKLQSRPKTAYQFCLQAHLPTIPASEHALLLFATHLATLNLTYPTIMVYIATVHNAYVITGNQAAFDKQSTPRLNQLMRGIRKHSSKTMSPRIWLPITADIMVQIKSTLKKGPKNYQQIMLWAACCTTFFSFLRMSEFTVPSSCKYGPSTHLSLSDVSLDN